MQIWFGFWFGFLASLLSDHLSHCINSSASRVEEPPLFVWHQNARERPEAREEVGERELADFRKQQKQSARDAKVRAAAARVV